MNVNKRVWTSNSRVAQVSQDLLVRKDCLDHRVLRVSLANRVQKEVSELQENWEHLDPKDTPVPLEQSVIRDHREPEVHRAN